MYAKATANTNTIVYYEKLEVREQVEVEIEPLEKKYDDEKKNKEDGENKDDQAEEKKDDIEVADEGEKEAFEPKEKKTKTVRKTHICSEEEKKAGICKTVMKKQEKFNGSSYISSSYVVDYLDGD